MADQTTRSDFQILTNVARPSKVKRAATGNHHAQKYVWNAMKKNACFIFPSHLKTPKAQVYANNAKYKEQGFVFSYAEIGGVSYCFCDESPLGEVEVQAQ